MALEVITPPAGGIHLDAHSLEWEPSESAWLWAWMLVPMRHLAHAQGSLLFLNTLSARMLGWPDTLRLLRCQDQLVALPFRSPQFGPLGDSSTFGKLSCKLPMMFIAFYVAFPGISFQEVRILIIIHTL